MRDMYEELMQGIDDLRKAMKMELPEHNCALRLIHNEHKNYYEEAGQWIVDHHDWCVWESPEAKQRAVDTDSIWTLQWYPDTPGGFYCIAAPTLDEALSFSKSINMPKGQIVD